MFVAQGKVLMGVARWEWEQEGRAATQRAKVATEQRTLQLRLSQAEAAARLLVVQTEMDAREAEIKLLKEATGSESALVRAERETLREMRHADDDPLPHKRRVTKSANGRPAGRRA